MTDDAYSRCRARSSTSSIRPVIPLLYDLEERTEAFVRQGMSAAAARRAALQQFGCVDEVRRRTRDVDTLEWFRPVVLGVRENPPRSSGRVWAAPVVVLVVVVAFGVALMRTPAERDLEIGGSVRPSASEPWPSHGGHHEPGSAAADPDYPPA